MSVVSISLTLAIRVVLVFLFLPFSALDKVLDFRGAMAQAQEAVSNKTAATALILFGLFVEVFMPAGVVLGIADRACAFVLAGYCAVTALVWKQFGAPAIFGVQATARPVRCSGIFGRTLLWPLAFFSSSSERMDRAVSRPSEDSIQSLPTDARARTAVSTESLPVVVSGKGAHLEAHTDSLGNFTPKFATCFLLHNWMRQL